MNIKLNEKIIKDRCGTVSFKKGDSFYRANHVTFENYGPDGCEATVTGKEDFHVVIKVNESGGLRTTCSCPTLASYQKDCQHIAAVLLAIYEHQRQGTRPADSSVLHSDSSTNQALTEGLLTIFNDKPIRSSRHLLHFEKRQVLGEEFICKPINIAENENMFGIQLKIGSEQVQNIRHFLEQVKAGMPCLLSKSFKYDPNLHCFQNDTDAVIQQLIQVIYDEKVYMDELPGKSNDITNQEILLIPPSSWDRLRSLLEKAPIVKLEYDGNIYEGLRLMNEPLSLQFDLSQAVDKGFQLKINGLEQMVVLNSYRSVLYEGKLVQMKREDCKRLSDLKQMLEASGTNQIPVPLGQLEFFMEKVVPGLRRLGNVQISDAVSKKFLKTPLLAKLYLDRVKNRLLAGLEFHYENFVMNPLERRELPAGSMLIRDVEKEDEILALMEDSLFAKTDGGYFLHNEELEYEFLYHAVPKLQKLAQLYATTAVRNRIFRENARPQIKVRVKKERTNWLEFKFEMDGISEKQIREVLLALEEKRKYYRLRNGSLMSLETREFEEINRFLNALPVQNENLENGLNLPIVKGLQLLDAADDHAFKLEESFHQFLEDIRNPGGMEFEVPKGLDSILRDYQKQGYQWMKTLAGYGFGGILADDMGLGKTLQSITYILSELPDIRKKKLPVLIVCPSSLTYNWVGEIMKFGPVIEAVVIDGNKTERLEIWKHAADMDVVITSYPLLRRDINMFEKQAFHTVFFDEAQAFKNPVTQTARAVKMIKAENRFALTGTPVENSLEELWSIFHVVFPELFLGLKEYSNLSRKKIARRIRPFLLRRLKEEVLAELPEKIESMDSVELLPEQRTLYAAYLAKLRHDTLKHLDKDSLRKNRIKILAGLTRLRQICCHPALFVDGYKGSSAKFEQLKQIVEESRLSGRRVLIFSQFTKMLELIGRDLAAQGIPFFYLDGQTPSKERVGICNRFNAGERDFFLISLKAGGTGLNLTGADTVILYDIWWNPAVEEQAADRAHRIGQRNSVQVIKLVSRGTIEEKINELQEKKRQLVEEIIDSEEKDSTALTEEDIREILMI
ncbi:SNF2 helicase associated domain-containing protein [Metabacillus idriensis]|uniref:DEAD/DEAH box helicase n=1 Tax=Metabacillus idriensis TaxID=324768 RepID=UPI002813FA00|nr:SNF2 helicase associated domain-containing protein [Metabacillus idriensis]MDR0137824.1 SNF2 helicase associated domain-containing protein [Metabacillus idriensis]